MRNHAPLTCSKKIILATDTVANQVPKYIKACTKLYVPVETYRLNKIENY